MFFNQKWGKAIRNPVIAKDNSDLKSEIVNALEDSKAFNTVVIDLAGKSDMADYMVIASGTSDRHVGAIAQRLIDHLKQKGIESVYTEGMRDCNWVLVDTADVVVHLFRPEVRDFYNLEKMWAVDLPQQDVLVPSA